LYLDCPAWKIKTIDDGKSKRGPQWLRAGASGKAEQKLHPLKNVSTAAQRPNYAGMVKSIQL
jgi:hypothetical protein